MRARCRDRNNEDYGGRGISVCAEWGDYAVFRAWAVANGYRKGLSIERNDVNGNYEPGNCRWATRAEQNANMRKTFRYKGQCAATLAQANGVSKETFWTRIRRGWPVERAIYTKPAPYTEWRI